VIEDFKIDMTAEEILGHLDARIQGHRDRAARCDAKRLRLEGVHEPIGPNEDDEDQQLAMCWPGYVEELERRVERHRRHEAALAFLRDHVVAHEIYRLGESDLRFLELGPRRRSGPAAGADADE
jgi:hypothetical protein